MRLNGPNDQTKRCKASKRIVRTRQLSYQFVYFADGISDADLAQDISSTGEATGEQMTTARVA
jgi:hypothetical protein